MKAFFANNQYDFFILPHEARSFPQEGLEVDLIHSNSRQPTGKRILLRFAEPEFGDAQIDLEPKGVCWDKSKRVLITARERYNDMMILEEHSNARLGSVGNVYFHFGDIEEN